MKSFEKGRRCRILYLARWYPSRLDPMPGLFIERHAQTTARFAEVAVLALIPTRLQKGFEREEHQGVITLRGYFRHANTKIKVLDRLINQYCWATALWKGYRQLSREKQQFDLIHVNVLTRLGVFALLLHYFSGIPFVITEHWTRYGNGDFKGFFRKLITRWVVRKASAISTPTQDLWNSMQHLGITNDHHMVLQNVVPDIFFATRSEEQSKNSNAVGRMIHVSCFTDRSKNISGLLRVLAQISMQSTDFECLLVGEGEDRTSLEAYAATLGLQSPRVQFKGLVEGEELVRLMQSSAFLVMFSHFENMPVVINEAFACGIPVISSDVGGIREQVHPWNGILVPDGDEEALGSAILTFLNQPVALDAQRMRNFAELWFSNDAVEKQLKLFYGL